MYTSMDVNTLTHENYLTRIFSLILYSTSII